MKKILLSIIFSTVLILISSTIADAVGCDAGKECTWLNVSNVTSFGVPWSASAQNFYNDGATKNHLCQMSGYEYAQGDAWATQQAKWSNCNGEYHVTWGGSSWNVRQCGSTSYVTNIYCARSIAVVPTDVCANISGNQETVPSNMSSDGSGNCSCDAGYTMSGSQCVAQNNPPYGGFAASCEALSGTAGDTDTISQSVSVHFYVDGPAGSGSFLGNTSTNSGGNYMMPTPSSIKNGTNRTIYAYALDTQGGPSSSIGQASINCVLQQPAVTAPSGNIGVTPSTLPSSGGTVTLSWAVERAVSCTASGAWSGDKGASGSESIYVSQSSTFYLNCSNSGGNWNGNASVYVSNPPVVVVPPQNPNPNPTNTPTNNQGSNGISYSNFPSSVSTNQSFSVTVTNTGSKTWGGGHDAGLKRGGSFVHLSGIGITPPGGQKTVSMRAPGTPGSVSLQAVEQGIEEFGGGPSIQVTAGTNQAGPNPGPGTTGNNPGGSGGPQPVPVVRGCTDPTAYNYNPSANSNNGSCVYAGFSLSANPNPVRAKSIAGYSGATEQDVQISVNPVFGFNVPVSIQVVSYPAEIKPEFSFDGGASWTPTPGASIINNPYYASVPVRIRFGAKLDRGEQYPFVFQGVGLGGGRGTGRSASVTVNIDSQPLYPDFSEL